MNCRAGVFSHKIENSNYKTAQIKNKLFTNSLEITFKFRFHVAKINNIIVYNRIIACHYAGKIAQCSIHKCEHGAMLVTRRNNKLNRHVRAVVLPTWLFVYFDCKIQLAAV